MSPFTLPEPVVFLELIKKLELDYDSVQQEEFGRIWNYIAKWLELQEPEKLAHARPIIQNIARRLKDHPRLLYGLNCILEPHFRIECLTAQPTVSFYVLVAEGHCEIQSISSDCPDFPSTKQDLQGILQLNDLWLETIESISNTERLSCIAQVLQEIVENPSVDEVCRRTARKRLYCLGKKGIVPPSIFIHFATPPSSYEPNIEHAETGGFCDAYKITVNSVPLCFRVLRQWLLSDSDKIYQQFARELSIWHQLKHPNILPLIGATTEAFPRRCCFVVPWLLHGSIMSFLKTHPNHDKYLAISQIVDGVTYLHGLDPPVIHKDLKGENVLMRSDLVCVITDFGLSGVLESHCSRTTTGAGTFYWMPPELHDDDPGHPSRDARPRDVYSLGCTVAQILTGCAPKVIWSAVIRREEPPLPPSKSPNWHQDEVHLWDIVRKCIRVLPIERPTIREVKRHLDVIRQLEPSHFEATQLPPREVDRKHLIGWIQPLLRSIDIQHSPRVLPPLSSPTFIPPSPSPNLYDGGDHNIVTCNPEEGEQDLSHPVSQTSLLGSAPRVVSLQSPPQNPVYETGCDYLSQETSDGIKTPTKRQGGHIKKSHDLGSDTQVTGMKEDPSSVDAFKPHQKWSDTLTGEWEKDAEKIRPGIQEANNAVALDKQVRQAVSPRRSDCNESRQPFDGKGMNRRVEMSDSRQGHSQTGWQTTLQSHQQYRLSKANTDGSNHNQVVHSRDNKMQPSSLMRGALSPAQPPEVDQGRDMVPIIATEGKILSQCQDLIPHPSFQHGSSQSHHYFQNNEVWTPNSIITFVGGDQNNNNRGDVGLRAIDMLEAHCAPSALLNSNENSEAARCADQTRTAILKALIAWVEKARLFALLGWLRGPAGAGKSTIAQTLGEECKKRGLLAATFFFSRTGSAEREDGNRLLPTIVSQLLQEFHDLRPIILEVISKDKFLFQKPLRLQFEKLLVEPFRIYTERHSTRPLAGSARLVIIDGLDECRDGALQLNLLKIMADAAFLLSYPLRFLIVSRPETHISYAFNHELVLQDDNPLRIDLDIAPDADTDIRDYLELEFNRMRTQHANNQLLPSLWPPEGAVDTLVERASKQFIYPVVAINFVWNNEDDPAQSLQLILNLNLAKRSPEMPSALLDELYTFVFSRVPNNHLDMFARLFALLEYKFPSLARLPTNVGETYKSLTFLERCLRLSNGQLWVMLKPLLPLLSIPNNPQNPQKNLKIYDASLSDFLKDPNRSNRLKFQLRKGRGWEALALYWLQPDESNKEGSRLHRLCEVLPNADLTNELKSAILNYDIPIVFEDNEPKGIWKSTGTFVDMLRKREDLHYEDFALLRHHTSKLIQVLQDELIKRKIWSSRKTFERPALPFCDTVLNTCYRLVDALCRFCILVGWGPAGEWSNLHFKHERSFVLIFLGRNREFVEHFTLESVDACASMWLDPEPIDDKDEVVRHAAKQVAQIRLQELSDFHAPQKIEEVMCKCGIRSLSKV